MLQSLNQLQKHTRRVLITKRTLPVFAFLLVAFMIIWPTLHKQKESLGISVNTSSGKGAKMDMENVRFFGLNDKNLPMTLTTPKGTETDPSHHVIRLEKPVATYQMNTKEKLVGKTPYALVYQDSERVLFEKDVVVKTTSGYTVNTKKVLCDYTQGTTDTDEHVSIVGPAGTIDSEGLLMADKGNSILFKKQVKAVIYQEKEKINISSPNGAQIDQTERTVTTLGKTTVLHQGNTLKANKMVAFYTNDKNKQIEKIVASGDVSIENGSQKMTGNEGTYYPETKIMFMLGNVALSQGKNVLKGDKATLNLITGENDLTAKERVKGQLIPSQFERNKK